jgi:trans-aconitate methyltransferase
VDSVAAKAKDLLMHDAPRYAFSHSWQDESRRLELLEQRLDPLTERRLDRLGIGADARCLEIGGGRGSIARSLAKRVGSSGHVTVTDLELGFLKEIEADNIEVLRHDVRCDTFPQRSFDLVHTRAVLMHIPDDLDVLRKLASWLAPGGWMLLEEPDFALWAADADPVWAARPDVWHRTFPAGSLSRGRSLLRDIHQLGLVDIDADAEVDIVRAGTQLAEFYRLSMAAIAPAAVDADALTVEQADAHVMRQAQPDLLACGFVHIGVWGRRPNAD